MRIQVKSKIFVLLLIFCLSFSSIAAASDSKCFKFDEKIVTPLKEEIPLPKEKTDGAKSGEREGKSWAQVRGLVQKPIEDVYKLLLDHNTTKSSRVEKLEVTKQDRPHFLQLHDVKFVIHPFKFLTVDWVERWAYSLAGGTPQKPTQIVTSYEKIEGTKYIEHLCGNIVLRKLGPKTTDVYIYEEAKARDQTAQDRLNGIVGTLKTLRTL